MKLLIMSKTWGLIIGCLAVLGGYSQQSGIVFEKAENWQQIVNNAKLSGKYIFVDCYTTWCMPCKEMSVKVYPNAYVGDFMNKHFINVEIQMDSSSKDNDHIRSWYKEASELKKRYNVKGFPTFLVFSPDGQILHKGMGAVTDTAGFVNKVKQYLKPERQYYTLQRQYRESKDVKLISALVNSAKEAGESPDAIGNDFIKSLKNPYTKENLDIIQRITTRVTDKGYALFFQNSKKVNDIMGQEFAEKLVKTVLWNDIVVPFFQANKENLRWNDLEAALKKKSNQSYAKEVRARAQYNYYGANKKWPEYEVSLLNYLKDYGHSVQPYLLNNMLWDIFLHTTDSTILKAYLPWAKKAIEYDSTFSAGMDTYANFLYKIGRVDEALGWEKKALEYALEQKMPDDQKVFQEAISKMEKGIKTWD